MAASACTPITLTPGSVSFIARPIPEIRPPPPTGTTTTSRSSACSIISRPMVPCPAMIAGSSKAGMKVAALSRMRWRACFWAWSKSSPWRSTVAP